MRLILCLCLLFASITMASTDKVKESLKAHLPDLTINSISPSPIKGLYQVNSAAGIIYLSDDGRYAISGDILDLANAQNNVTENVRKQDRVKGLQALGESSMIIFSPPKPQYTVTVFTDVDCGYCRKFHSEIAKINEQGIAVRYLPFPRSGPGSQTFEKMVKIWCAKDKKLAMIMANQDKSFESPSCDQEIIKKAFQFGVMSGVAGTPSILFEDGSLFPGYLPANKLREVAEQIKAKKA